MAYLASRRAGNWEMVILWHASDPARCKNIDNDAKRSFNEGNLTMRILVVGGGPSGLVASYNLSKRKSDTDVLLIEKQERFGGLAKSFVYDGGYVFDIGPKRFHTEDEEVLSFIHEIGSVCPLATIDRSSKVHFLNKIFDWPLRGKELLKLPPVTCIKSARDLIRPRPTKIVVLP